MFDDHSRVAVVTGSAGGIGREVVAELRRRDYAVVALARQPAGLDNLGSDPLVRRIAWDQTEAGSVPETVAGQPRVDALIHVAATAPIARVADTTADDFTRLVAVNLTSAAALTGVLLPALRRAEGHVVFVSNSAGLRAIPGWGGYLGTKSALRDLADSLRAEEGASGVKVTTVFPGAVATDLLKQVREGFGRPYDPDQCTSVATAAGFILSVLDHPDDGYLTELSFGRG